MKQTTKNQHNSLSLLFLLIALSIKELFQSLHKERERKERNNLLAFQSFLHLLFCCIFFLKYFLSKTFNKREEEEEQTYYVIALFYKNIFFADSKKIMVIYKFGLKIYATVTNVTVVKVQCVFFFYDIGPI
jgi:hypothetical protein